MDKAFGEGVATVSGDATNGWTVTVKGMAYPLSANGTVGVGEKIKVFNAAEWDKTSSDDDCFIWASDDPTSEDYGTVIGYTAKAQNNTKLKYPSRTKQIKFEYVESRYNGIGSNEVRAFTNGIKKVEIPETVTIIGDNAFHMSTGGNSPFQQLEEVNIPNSVTSIGNSAFYNCISLTKIDIPDSVTTIGSQAFRRCIKLTTITIPNSITSIGDSAFSECESLESITIPNSITTINGSTFSSCKNLTNITIPNSVTSIGGSAFSNCISLTKIDIPNSVTTIGMQAFQNCKNLTNITIPDSVTSIGVEAFSECTSLNNIIIPNSVTNVEYCVFTYWTKSQTIKIRAESKPIGWSTMWNKKWDNSSMSYIDIDANIIWGYTGN